MRRKIILAVTAILIISSAVVFLLIPKGKPVETAEAAINIAKNYVIKEYDQDFSEYVIKINEEEDVWIVFYSLNYGDRPLVVGGGGPSVHIRKCDGKIIKCYLQK